MNYESNSRFVADADCKTLTRKGVTMTTVVVMKTPIRGPDDSLYIVPMAKQYRWDLVAEEILGDPSEKWILMRHNRIEDPFDGPKSGDRLLVPTQDQIKYYKNL